MKHKFGQPKPDERGFFLYRRLQGKNYYCRIKSRDAVNYMTISWYIQNRWSAVKEMTKFVWHNYIWHDYR